MVVLRSTKIELTCPRCTANVEFSPMNHAMMSVPPDKKLERKLKTLSLPICTYINFMNPNFTDPDFMDLILWVTILHIPILWSSRLWILIL
jgi:hypothetical protein